MSGLTDKKTIGVTDAMRGALEDLTKRGAFNEQLDSARFAVALAVDSGVAPGSVEGAGTIWNIGSFDPDGSMAKMITILYPDTVAPYRTLESLLDQGLKLYASMIECDSTLTVASILRRQEQPQE